MADKKVKPQKKLSPQHKKLADEWLESWNGTQAAIKAGYSPKNAAHQAMEVLRRPEVKTYIEERLAERAASQNETVSFLTSVMRGEVKDAFGLDASLSDRIGAAKELLKRHTSAGTTQQSLDKLDELIRGIDAAAKQ